MNIRTTCSDRELARRLLSPRRFAHCEGVEATCARLAERFGVAVPDLPRAGLLHDLARERLFPGAFFPPAELLSAGPAPRDYGFTEADSAAPILLHGVESVALIRKLLRPLPPDLERAVALHPVGDPTLAPASLLLMIADLVEPTRDYPRVHALREEIAACPDLRSAAKVSLFSKFRHHRRAGFVDHPLTAATLAAL